MLDAGILRYVNTAPLYDSLRRATLAIVEFPDCTFRLEGLPTGWFPVVPVTRTVKIKVLGLDGVSRNVSVQRTQLPLQLAFAVTAHGAQGRTLEFVAANMRHAGPARYVAVSRATTREGLALIGRIRSAKDLNPKPWQRVIALGREMKRIEALAHNTLAKYRPERGLACVEIPEHPGEKAVEEKMEEPEYEVEGGPARSTVRGEDASPSTPGPRTGPDHPVSIGDQCLDAHLIPLPYRQARRGSTTASTEVRRRQTMAHVQTSDRGRIM